MEDDDLSPAERERMRRFDEWLRVSRGVLARRALPLALAFCVLAALFGAALVRRAAASPFRYVAETRLLFSPRQAPKVQAMGDRQLLGVLDRESVKRAAGARLGLAPEAAAGLEGALSLKQEKKPRKQEQNQNQVMFPLRRLEQTIIRIWFNLFSLCRRTLMCGRRRRTGVK